MHKFSFVALLLLVAFTSCKKEEWLNCTVEYNIRIPAPVLKIAEAYAEYTDNGQTHTEPMPNGQWTKTFSYSWEDNAVNQHDYGFNTLKIYLRPKVGESQFKAGVQLLEDSQAVTTCLLHYDYKLDKDNKWAGTSNTASSSGTVGGNYVFDYKTQAYKYTVAEQIAWFNSQTYDPYVEVKCNHVGTKMELYLEFNTGQPDTKSGLKLVQ